MGMAAAMLMTGCANDDELGGGAGGQQTGNSDEPIVLSVGQQSNKTRAALGNVDENGAYDGTFDANGLGVYCLATGKIFATENITWKTGYDNPNFRWMENVKSDAVTALDADLNKKVTNLKFYDAETGTTETNYFYPMGSQYRYTFYGYYPYNQTVTHDENGEKYTVAIENLNGTTDLIWGKSLVSDDDAAKDYAYSAKYIRAKKAEYGAEWDKAKYKSVLPKITFKHKLMKFNIILKKGTGTGVEQSTTIQYLGIKSCKLLNVADKGELVIANLNSENAADADKEGAFNVDWTSAANHNIEATALVLKDKDGTEISDANDPGPVLGDQEQVKIGDCFLVPVPKSNGDGTYEDNGYQGTDNAELANKGIFRLRIDFYRSDEDPHKTYRSAQYEVRPIEGETWQEGYEYDIVISVSDPEQIQLGAELTPWEKRTIELE